MSLVELIGRADERGLAASALACLDRCVPLLGGDDEVLRPLWSSLAEGGDADAWGALLAEARGRLGAEPAAGEEAALLAWRMLATAPGTRTAEALRVWADACSVASLRAHRLLDPAGGGADRADPRGEGRTEEMSPLVAAELRRQVTVLELLAGRGAGGLRPALEVTVEGRRVLRAVVSRRARVGG
ncbi:hypothetical protein [Streptomyces sp. NPDC006997]|uniref:hypothetical protein n=1 Tax=Streptomyces sp. NPDC006997 TaxID=3155356 RepID=UPI00340286A7